MNHMKNLEKFIENFEKLLSFQNKYLEKRHKF